MKKLILFSAMTLIFLSSISCKKNGSVSTPDIVPLRAPSQSWVYYQAGPYGPAVKLCFKLYNGGVEITPTGFGDLNGASSFATVPCGTDPAAIGVIPTPTSAEPQTVKAIFSGMTDKGKSLTGRSLTIEKDIPLSKEFTAELEVENAAIKAGTYTFNEKNELLVDVAFGKGLPKSDQAATLEKTKAATGK